jgi:NADH:ubiquinone oxidoreductase subunit 6 (subunit J)
MQGIELLLEQMEFFVIAAIVLILAYLALEHKDIVYAVFFFGLMASFVAGFFLLLEAPFIAGMQIAVYTGGISALIVFGVLLLPRAQDSSLETFASPERRTLGLLISGSVMFLSGALALVFPWYETFPEGSVDLSQSLQGLAEWLWSQHGIYIQIIGLIILTAVVGSIAVLRMEKAERLATLTGKFGVEAAPDPETGVEDEVDEEAGNE